MKPFLNICLAQVNPRAGNLKYNLSKLREIISTVREKVHLLIFPRWALTGAPLEGLPERREFQSKVEGALWDLLAFSKGSNLAILLSFPLAGKEGLSSCEVLIYEGSILAQRVSKSVLTWRNPRRRGFERAPVNPQRGSLGFVLNGFICRVFSPEELAYTLKESWERGSGQEIRILLDSAPYLSDYYSEKERGLRELAKGCQSYLLYVNLSGAQEDIIFDGRSMVISPEGEILARARPFVEDLLFVTLKEPPLSGEGGYLFLEMGGQVPCLILEKPFMSFDERIEEFPIGEAELYEALKVGIWEYVEKNGFKGVIFGLSGGMDSALVATLAVDALGRERVKAVFMPSEFTSPESREDARALAENLGISLIEFPITEIFRLYRDEIAKYLGYGDFTVAEENLQARIRANILYYISNREGLLVLSTSNKSESATGYGTIYGDMAGGYAPLKDIYKTVVYRLARYRNTLSPVIPERIFIKAPSAELRPGQTDQEVLPPYEILDEILRLFIEEGCSPEEIVERGFERELVKKVLRMLINSEHKRRQTPIGPRVSRVCLWSDLRYPLTRFEI